MEQSEFIHLTVNHLVDTWTDLATRLTKNPDKLAQNQANYWQDYLRLYQDLTQSTDTSDKRFQYQEWQQNIVFNFIKQSYLLMSQHIESLINDVVQNEEEKIAQKLRFFTRQFLDAAAPTNFPQMNPEVLAKTLESNGISLVAGFKQFMEDIESGNIKMTDVDTFHLGENLAATPGKIVYQNDLMQLIQYTSSTEQTYEIPLLIIPPWINKYYILDLQEDNSFVRWLVNQGYTVFMISWVNPGSQHRKTEFADYMTLGPLTALRIMEEITGQSKANLVGYCIGGTLLGCMLAYLSAKNECSIVSATFLTTLLDFSEPGELGLFVDEKQLNTLENFMQKKGYLDGYVMATVFNALRANDLIWSTFVNNYLKGQKPKAFDLLYWNSDSTNIPAPTHSYYLRNMYLDNNLVQANKMTLNHVPIDLGKISLPTYFLATQDDHIVPWKTCYKGMQVLKGKSKFVLATSGHVAGVINPPTRTKYGYWTNLQKPQDPEEYLAKASFHEGSWWDDWQKWLKKHSGKLIEPNFQNNPYIEDAPGSYVKIKSTGMQDSS
ncbi:MAG: PHA/PHB synthase family protein [Gammaproteobacteria bacterium]